MTMKKVFQIDELEQLVQNNPMVLAYFSGENCSVCLALKPKIEHLLHSQYPEIKLVEIPVEHSPQLVGRFSVFTVPVVMVWIDGLECIREVRSISIKELSQRLDKLLSLYE
jgi:thioredoxin 1